MTTCGVCNTPVRKPDLKTCAECGIGLCLRDQHYYVDDSNIAITRSARPFCEPHSGRG